MPCRERYAEAPHADVVAFDAAPDAICYAVAIFMRCLTPLLVACYAAIITPCRAVCRV